MLKYREYESHVSLQEHVKCFWTMHREYTPEYPAEDVTPDLARATIASISAALMPARANAMRLASAARSTSDSPLAIT